MIDAGSELHEYAARLRAHAQNLRAIAHLPSRTLMDSGWEGARAGQMLDRLNGRADEITHLATECEDVARVVERLAEDLHVEIRRMQRLESELRAWLRAAPQEAAHALLAATRLPEPGAPAWMHVARIARGLGAPL